MHVFSGEERGEAEANRSFHWTNGKNHGTSVFFSSKPSLIPGAM
jgi:hypothetical protein